MKHNFSKTVIINLKLNVNLPIFFLTYLTDIDVALHDGVVGGLVDTSGFHTNEGRLEEGLGASETLVTNGDDLRDINYKS